MMEEPVTFHSQNLRLRGLLYKPQTAGPMRAAVVCHPHPLYGGSMQNNVVEAILEALWALDCATLRFDFRGVRGSEGQYDEGRGEVSDAVAAVRFVTNLPGMSRDRVILAGYSFGATVAAHAAMRLPEVFTLVAVAPPMIADGWAYLAKLKAGLVLVGGEHDRYCPPTQLEAMRAEFLGAVRMKIISGADHFFTGQEAQVTEALTQMLRGT